MSEVVKLDIPAKAEYVVLGRLALAGLLRSRGFTSDAIADLKLALTEACSNSVRHAHDHGSDKVHLAFVLHDHGVTVEIRDDGGGLHEDGEDCPDCQSMSGLESAEGGMGISIIRAVVDGFELRKPGDGGTVLVLDKHRDA